MNIKKSDIFQTSDLTLAATLSIWFPVESVDRSDPSRVLFFFEQSQKLTQLLDSFWKSELQVEPKLFANQLKNLKTRIRAQD